MKHEESYQVQKHEKNTGIIQLSEFMIYWIQPCRGQSGWILVVLLYSLQSLNMAKSCIKINITLKNFYEYLICYFFIHTVSNFNFF